MILPASLGSDAFEEALEPLRDVARGQGVTFDCSGVEFAPLDVLVAAMLLCNEMAGADHRVTIEWGRRTSVMKYAERMGFFRLLDAEVRVKPRPPQAAVSLYNRHRRHNASLLEMSAVDLQDPTTADRALASLRTSLGTNLMGLQGVDPDETEADLWTFCAETVGNIYEHSESAVPGIVAAQPYGGEHPRFHLVIADGGLGIPATIRRDRPADADGKSDAKIVLEAFRSGLSRSQTEVGRGCGLTRCAAIAMRYQANLRVRVGRSWTKLITKSRKTGITLGIYDDNAVPISGTQISFDFYLGRMGRAG